MDRIHDYLDREMSAREMKWVKAHLAICHACSAKFDCEAEFTAALRARLDCDASLEEAPELPAKISAALHRTTQSELND